MINICLILWYMNLNCSLCFYGVLMHEGNCQRVTIQFTVSVSLDAQIVLVP